MSSAGRVGEMTPDTGSADRQGRPKMLGLEHPNASASTLQAQAADRQCTSHRHQQQRRQRHAPARPTLA